MFTIILKNSKEIGNMTQEDKELILRDLSARLPYGVKYMDLWNPDELPTILCDINVDVELIMNTDGFSLEVEKCKPYLFPLSSMTEDQHAELLANGVSDDPYTYIDGKAFNYLIDFYNKNHFDYRGLIDNGLALDATGLSVY